MSIHLPFPPTHVDLSRKLVSGRDGLYYPLDDLAFSDDALYFSRHGAANPAIAYQQRWLLPEQGWVVIRWTLHADAAPLGYDWYIDLDRIDIDGDRWVVTDRYLDLIVREGVGYEVLDADELADAVTAGTIAVVDAVGALRSLDGLCKALRKFDFSMAAVLREFAPGLPIPSV